MNKDMRLITPKEAINLLNDGESIHTFRNPNGMLIGCDWDRSVVIEKLRENPERIEIGGEGCRKINHGLVLHYEGVLFIETNEEKLNAFDPV